jgi:hypothetical protein
VEESSTDGPKDIGMIVVRGNSISQFELVGLSGMNALPTVR